jgi:hypothetical protein
MPTANATDLESTEKTTTQRRTAVSQVLRAISDEVECGATESEKIKQDFQIGRVLIAKDSFTLMRACRLAYRVYASCGYVADDPNGMIVTAYDADPETFTLLIEDADGCEVATVTLIFDSNRMLPCDEIYSPEVSQLRSRGKRLVEVTRLAIDSKYTGSKRLLLRFFDLIFIYARRVRGCDDCLIEVNPRHVNYYRRMMRFEIAGSARPCPRVNGAPAVLLRLDLGVPESELGDRAHETQNIANHEFTIERSGFNDEHMSSSYIQSQRTRKADHNVAH